MMRFTSRGQEEQLSHVHMRQQIQLARMNDFIDPTLDGKVIQLQPFFFAT
jgi:hypothetical protein